METQILRRQAQAQARDTRDQIAGQIAQALGIPEPIAASIMASRRQMQEDLADLDYPLDREFGRGVFPFGDDPVLHPGWYDDLPIGLPTMRLIEKATTNIQFRDGGVKITKRDCRQRRP